MDTCPNCGRQCGTPDFTTRSTYLWANGHGQAKRIFCQSCKMCHDVTYINDTVTVKVVPLTWNGKTWVNNEMWLGTGGFHYG